MEIVIGKISFSLSGWTLVLLMGGIVGCLIGLFYIRKKYIEIALEKQEIEMKKLDEVSKFETNRSSEINTTVSSPITPRRW